MQICINFLRFHTYGPLEQAAQNPHLGLPDNHYFLMAFRWGHVEPRDPAVKTRLMRLAITYVSPAFTFYGNDNVVNRIIQLDRLRHTNQYPHLLPRVSDCPISWVWSRYPWANDPVAMAGREGPHGSPSFEPSGVWQRPRGSAAPSPGPVGRGRRPTERQENQRNSPAGKGSAASACKTRKEL